jgi:hypothetical protein
MADDKECVLLVPVTESPEGYLFPQVEVYGSNDRSAIRDEAVFSSWTRGWHHVGNLPFQRIYVGSYSKMKSGYSYRIRGVMEQGNMRSIEEYTVEVRDGEVAFRDGRECTQESLDAFGLLYINR